MIVFDLICDEEHRFEGWFRNSEDFEAQLQTGMLTCPMCGSEDVSKILSPSRLNFGKQEKQAQELFSIRQDAEQLAARISQYINDNFENVGEDFADEARKMFYGESEERNIRGVTSISEAQELYEDGIDIFPVPVPEDDKDKLN